MPGSSASPATHPEFLELDRITELDGVRGLALVMVLWLHCFLVVPSNLLFKLLNSIGGSMFIAIDLFFVLSGFLITGILIRTRDKPRRARNFYARRVLRIFPAYYFTLILIFLLYPIFYAPLREAPIEGDAVYFFLYVQNWLFAWREAGSAWPGLNHLWSMAIEEQFYLLWPLVVWYTPPAKLARVCAWIFGLAIALKLALLASGASLYQVYLPTYSRLEGLAAGAGVAALWHIHGVHRTPPWLRLAGLTATLCLLALMFRTHTAKADNATDIVAHTLTSTVAFAWMIYASVTADPRALVRRFFRHRVLRFLGRYSYGIYLLHYVVYWQIKYFVLDVFKSQLGAAASVLAGILIVATTIVLALAMYRFLEEPALRLKRYFTSASVPAAAKPP